MDKQEQGPQSYWRTVGVAPLTPVPFSEYQRDSPLTHYQPEKRLLDDCSCHCPLIHLYMSFFETQLQRCTCLTWKCIWFAFSWTPTFWGWIKHLNVKIMQSHEYFTWPMKKHFQGKRTEWKKWICTISIQSSLDAELLSWESGLQVGLPLIYMWTSSLFVCTYTAKQRELSHK